MGRAVFREAFLRGGDLLRSLSSSPASTSVFVRRLQTGGGDDSSFENSNDFEKRLFGDMDGGGGGNSDPFYRKLDKVERSHARSNTGTWFNGDTDFSFNEGPDGNFDSLSDGMDEELKQYSRKFFKHSEEIKEEDYSFRPDVNFRPGDTYTTRDLDLTKPAARRQPQRREFETTTQEVLKKADFRNVRFLSNFLTEAGIIIKRSQTKISAKAQRKVAREIKTARAMGLMPFTSMGTKPYIFGRNMKDNEEDYEYNTFDDQTGVNDVEPMKE